MPFTFASSPLSESLEEPTPHRVGFLRRLGLKTGILHFGLESSMVFEGATRLYERLYRFNSK